MSSTPKTQIRKLKSETVLLTVGGLLYGIWPIIVAVTSSPSFYCNLVKASGCSDSDGWQDVFLLGPTLIGACMFSLGLVYRSKLVRPLKIIAGLCVTGVLMYFGYWLTFLWFWVEMLIHF